MDKLYVKNELISNLVDKSILKYEDNKVSHRLLNGSYVVQAIGEVNKCFEIECHVTGEQKELFDRAYAGSSLLTLIKDGVAYLCYVEDYPQVAHVIKKNRAKNEWFTLSFILHDSGEL